ncbi:hypothetical protein C8Q70DRAFT_926020 [Cubamyces menziesii]|nr:hypothetical protein C8Q70DRAFT_926020 [Cubamyces menziesii]
MATPMKRAAPGPWCDGLGSGVFDTSSSFTLAAYNTTGPNTDSTGAPLVLGTAGAFQQTQIWHFISWGSYPITYPTVSLENGTLILQSDGATPAQATTVDAGNSLEFAARASANPLAGAQIYCAVVSLITLPPSALGDAGLPLLAVNNDADSFSLCQTTFENAVYYKAAPDRGYDFDSCYPVKLQILFQ